MKKDWIFLAFIGIDLVPRAGTGWIT